MPNIEIKIWTIEKGKLKEIIIPEFDNQIFVVKEKKQTTLEKAHKAAIELMKPTTTRTKSIFKTTQSLDKGKTITLNDKQTIHSNVLEECKQQADMGNYDFMPIVKKYYPNLRLSSYRKYVYNYRNYLNIKVGRGRKLSKTTNNPKVKRRRTKPSPECDGYDKTYQTWIKKDEMQKVKQGICTVGFDYIPNTKNISKQSGLTKSRTCAVLHYMKQKGLIKQLYKNGTSQYNMAT